MATGSGSLIAKGRQVGRLEGARDAVSNYTQSFAFIEILWGAEYLHNTRNFWCCSCQYCFSNIFPRERFSDYSVLGFLFVLVSKGVGSDYSGSTSGSI